MFGRKKDFEEPVQEASENIEETKENENEAQESQEEESALSQLARLTADFQNYRKRVEKDRALWMDRSRMDVLLPLLAVVDDFDRALQDAEKNEDKEKFQSWIKGFEMIRTALYDFLAQQKVVVIEQVKTFDPLLHEAVMQVESADHESGEVVQVMQTGYMHKDQVLRTAKVSVAK